MKRILLSLMMAGGLAMLAAPYANAAAPGECGKTYAILLSGNQESTNRATGGYGLSRRAHGRQRRRHSHLRRGERHGLLGHQG